MRDRLLVIAHRGIRTTFHADRCRGRRIAGQNHFQLRVINLQRLAVMVGGHEGHLPFPVIQPGAGYDFHFLDSVQVLQRCLDLVSGGVVRN